MSQPDLLPVERRPRGRPRSDEVVRLSALLKLDVDLNAWPQTSSPCWQPDPAPPLVWMNGRPTTPLRACFEVLIGQQMHKTWRLKRTCSTRGCVNPHHHRVHLSFRKDALSPPEPPHWLLMAEVQADVLNNPEPQPAGLEAEIEECLDLITDASGHDLPLDELLAKLNGFCRPEVVELAWHRLHAPLA